MPVTSLAAGMAKVRALEPKGAPVSLDFAPDEVAALKAKLLKLTEATVIVRSPRRDPETGRCDYVEVPDSGIQLAATVKALEFAVGKPKVMMEVQTGDGPHLSQGQSLGKLLAGNPDVTARVISLLKDSLENSQALPVQALPPDSKAKT